MLGAPKLGSESVTDTNAPAVELDILQNVSADLEVQSLGELTPDDLMLWAYIGASLMAEDREEIDAALTWAEDYSDIRIAEIRAGDTFLVHIAPEDTEAYAESDATLIVIHSEHAEGEAVVENNAEPTCTEAGGYDEVVYCTVCGEELSREAKTVAALGHDVSHHEAKAATCTEIGWNEYDTCSRCDYSTYEAIPALGHNYTATVTAPTCTEQGYTTYTCSRCGDSYADSYVDALGHETELRNAAEANCTEAGYTGDLVCTRCGETVTWGEEIPAKGHTEVIDAAVEADCTETGLTEGKHCSVCNEVLVAQEVVPARGHDLVHHEGKAATCTEAGWNAYDTCSRCDYSTYEAIPALGHNYTATVTAPTCTEQGYTTYTCSRCGDSYADSYVDALGHETELRNAAEANCTEAGYTGDLVCTRCGETVTWGEEIPAKGHTEVIDAAVEADCTETGLTEGKHCSVCNEVLVAQEVVPARGHDLVPHEAKAATCTEIGWNAYDTCSRCDYSTYEAIPALGHDYQLTDTVAPQPILEKDANGYDVCTGWNTGSKTYTCSHDESHTYSEPVKVPTALYSMAGEWASVSGKSMTIDLGVIEDAYGLKSWVDGTELTTVGDIINQWLGIVPYNSELNGWWLDSFTDEDMQSALSQYMLKTGAEDDRGSFVYNDPSQAAIGLLDESYQGGTLTVYLSFVPTDTSTYERIDNIAVKILWPAVAIAPLSMAAPLAAMSPASDAGLAAVEQEEADTAEPEEAEATAPEDENTADEVICTDAEDAALPPTPEDEIMGNDVIEEKPEGAALPPESEKVVSM